MPNLTQTGRYTATITGAALGESQTGTAYLSLDFHTEAGDITGFLYFTEKTRDGSLQTLTALGFDGNFERLDQLNGIECSITVEEEQDEKTGKTRLRVRWVNPPRREAPAGLAQSLTSWAKSQTAKPPRPAGAALAARTPAAPPRPTAPAKPAPTPAAADIDGDVPF
jgi:hypothetical protein